MLWLVNIKPQPCGFNNFDRGSCGYINIYRILMIGQRFTTMLRSLIFSKLNAEVSFPSTAVVQLQYIEAQYLCLDKLNRNTCGSS